MSVGRVLAVVAVALAVSPSTAAAAGTSAEQLTLRLPDLGPNYTEDSYCDERISSEVIPRPVKRLARRLELRWCLRDFTRDWPVPGHRTGPRTVESAALLFQDAASATSGFNAERRLAAGIAGTTQLTRRAAPIGLGEGATAYDVDVSSLPPWEDRSRPGTVVVWRSGPAIGLVVVYGRSPLLARDAAVLAAAQQRRIATPTPIAPSDFDERLVPFYDPQFRETPWLSMRFAPGGGLPPLRLERADRDGDMLSLSYVGRHSEVDVTFLPPRTWARIKGSRAGRRVFSQVCEKRRFQTPNGPATGFFYDEGNDCDLQSVWHGLFATQRLGRFVVAVSTSAPMCCLPERVPLNWYDTWRGLRVVLRGLEPRPAPSLPATPFDP